MAKAKYKPMDNNKSYITKTTKLGKYAGTCEECDLMRGTEDSPICGRCGHTHTTEAVARDLNGNIKTED